MLPRGSSNRGARGARGTKASDGGATRSRGRGRGSSKTVRFASPPEQSSTKAGSSSSVAIDSRHASSPFSAPRAATQGSNASPNLFGAPSNPFSISSTTSDKSAPSHDQFARQTKVNTTPPNLFGSPTNTAQTSSAFGAPFGLNGVFKPSSLRNSFTALNATIPGLVASPAANPFNSKPEPPVFSTPTNATSAIDATLRQQGIIVPSWPETRDKSTMEAFWKAMKTYRVKARVALIRAGLLDDPDKPKKLSEAIDFKGTCEGMCPEFEKINRIIEHDVQGPEKEHTLKYGYGPSPPIMVKALARSAAGQDSPLPEDIRSPAALRRTLDYLIDNLLGRNDLPEIHGFLWDRTRAIRRDFVFQQSSMNSQELLDQVYCLENITRFHVIALHQMSGKDIVADDFSEQQEVEQLGKALLSLIHAYEDCIVQGVTCENEKEFRAYYTLFNSHNTGILEAVQDWGWNYWGKSDEIRIAVSLIETLQNIWDIHGPLKPHAATDIAQNAYHRFFSIIEDTEVSYTMACFAEIHFNKVRKAALKTILAGYRKQRDQTRDWTLQRLNTYLRFDDEQEIVAFGEAYGLQFEDVDGDTCLSFDSDDSMTDPFPQLKQYHSKNLVERKRGEHKLLEVIHRTVFEESTSDEGMFVPESPSITKYSQSTKPLSLDTLPRTLNNEDLLPLLMVGFSPKESAFTGRSASQSPVSPFSFNNQKPVPASKDVSLFHPEATKSFSFEATRLSSPESTQQSIVESKDGNRETLFVPGTDSLTLVNNTFSFLGSNKTAPTPTIQSNSRLLGLKSESKLFGGVDVRPNSKPQDTLIQPKPNGNISIFQSNTQLQTSGFAAIGAPSQTPGPDSLEPRVFASDKLPFQDSVSDRNLHADNSSTSNSKKIPESSSPTAKQSVDAESQMLAFANWMALGDEGLIDQFIGVTVEDILSDTIARYHAEETKSRLEREERLAREEAIRFRLRSLAKKYGRRWRHIAHRLWLRRKGREAREARRRMAEEKFRESKVIQGKSLIDEFRASGDRKRQASLEQALFDTGVLNGISHVDDKIRNIVEGRDSQFQENFKTQKSTPKMVNGKSKKYPNYHRSQSGDVCRENTLTDSSYLQGGSRIHLIPNYSPDTEGRRQPNGVQTDYFRLKARGIMTLSDGTPLASTAAVHLPYQGHSFNKGKSATPERPMNKSTPRDVPEKKFANEIDDLNVVKGQDSIEALKARAKAIMHEDDEIRQRSKKRLLDKDDEELFAKAKKIREQMDEGAEWFRIETQKSLSRSVS